MNKKDPKILIPLIRKIYPKMMAAQITGIQPMSPGVGDLFNLGAEWSEWRCTFSFWPRRSVTGKLIFGRINKRGKWEWEGKTNPNTSGIRFSKTQIYEFATNKELFTARLKGKI